MKKFIMYFWKHKIVSSMLLLLIAGGSYWYYSSRSTTSSPSSTQTTQVKSREVRASIAVSGTVASNQTATLSFGSSAKVTKVYVKNGDKVESGSIIAEIDAKEIEIQRAKDKASLSSSKAQLEKTKNGLSPEERASLEVSLSNAKLNYEQTIRSADSDIKNAELALNQAQKIYDTTIDKDTIETAQKLQDLQNVLNDSQKKLESTLATNKNTIENSVNSVKTAELNLSTSQSSASANSTVQSNNLAKAQEDTFYNASTYLTQAETTLQKINEIITIEDSNKDAHALWRSLFGVQKVNSYNIALESYYIARDVYRSQQYLFSPTQKDFSYEEMFTRLSILENILKTSYTALDTTYDMLQYTITSADFTQSILDSYRQSIFTQRNNITQALSGISSAKNNVTTAQVQQSAQQVSSDNSIKNAEKSLENAKASLVTTKIQAAESERLARLAVKNAADALAQEQALLKANTTTLNLINTLENAQRSLETTKEKAQTQRESAEASLRSAQAQYDQQTAPADSATIASQVASVRQAEATLASTKNTLSRTKITAPISGYISGLTIHVGDQVSTNASVGTIISEHISLIETNLPETTLSKVTIGMPVEITLDAFQNAEKITGTVSYIDHEKTTTDSIVSYKTQIVFDTPEKLKETIRSGMTASLAIITSTIPEALSLPNQAVKSETRNGQTVYYVRIKNKQTGTIEKKHITIGVKGNDYTEIVEGLTEGEEVVLSSTGTTSSSTRTTNSNSSSNTRNNASIPIPRL